MIQKLKHGNRETAIKIDALFKASYTVEAKLLNVTNFPPLNRPLESYQYSKTIFFGYFMQQELVGIVEINNETNTTFIDSLVVHPMYFRQGIAKQLMLFVLRRFESNNFVVQTALNNEPAVNLYCKLDFKEIKQWDALKGLRLIKLERKSTKTTKT